MVVCFGYAPPPALSEIASPLTHPPILVWGRLPSLRGQILKSTPFSRQGWGGSMIGLFWGGITVQGILPYYYEVRGRWALRRGGRFLFASPLFWRRDRLPVSPILAVLLGAEREDGLGDRVVLSALTNVSLSSSPIHKTKIISPEQMTWCVRVVGFFVLPCSARRAEYLLPASLHPAKRTPFFFAIDSTRIE